MRSDYTIDGFIRRGYQDPPQPLPSKKRRKKLLPVFAIAVVLLLSVISYSTIKKAPTVAAQKKVDKKVKFLAGEIIELKKYETELQAYEDQLRLRSELIDTILGDIKDFDFERLVERSEETVDPNDNGMGGGVDLDLSADDAFLMPSEKRKLAVIDSALTKEQLLEKLDLQLQNLKHIPLGLPSKGRLSSGYGYRKSPFRKGRTRQMHHGVDVAVDWRSPVNATADGIVVKASWKGAYGKTVMIDHGNGIKTLYGHLTKISVKEGDNICRGQRLGFAGSTGRSTGPHVHYEVRVNGKPKNPMPFVKLASYLNLL